MVLGSENISLKNVEEDWEKAIKIESYIFYLPRAAIAIHKHSLEILWSGFQTTAKKWIMQ